MKRNTKEQFSEALYQLLQDKTMNEVTVQEILTQAQLGHSTFYRHFSDKYDVLTYLFHHRLSPAIFHHASEKDYCSIERDYIQFLSAYEPMMRNIIEDDHNIFIHLLYTKYLQLLSKDVHLTTTQYHILEIYLHGTIMTSVSWFRKGIQKSPEEQMYLFKEALPYALKDLF